MQDVGTLTVRDELCVNSKKVQQSFLQLHAEKPQWRDQVVVSGSVSWVRVRQVQQQHTDVSADTLAQTCVQAVVSAGHVMLSRQDACLRLSGCSASTQWLFTYDSFTAAAQKGQSATCWQTQWLHSSSTCIYLESSDTSKSKATAGWVNGLLKDTEQSRFSKTYS